MNYTLNRFIEILSGQLHQTNNNINFYYYLRLRIRMASHFLGTLIHYSSMAISSHVTGLPSEVLEHIFGYLTAEDLST